MYSVSNEYISALRRSVKYDRITGQIRLADGTRIEINNNVVIQGKLSITRSVCGGSFDIGAFNAARMSITIKDEAAYDHEFGNATISLCYGLLTDIENDMWEDVPLGVFYVDGHYTTRSGGTVSLQAFDSAGKFEVEPPKLDGVTTLYGALQQACLKANVGLAISESEFNAFPNAAIVPSFTNARIQSCRDIVIWVAQAVGTSAFIGRNNTLTLKRYYYAGGDVYDRLFTANERSKIKFTDTRTYFAYLSNYCAGEPKMYSNILSFTGADAPHVKEGGLTLPENPLLLALAAEEQDTANMALMENYSAPTRYIKATGTTDPAIDPLDVVAFKDGSIDIGQIISVCTKIQWKYRGSGYIECNNFDEYSVDNSVSAVALADTETQTDTNYARTPPKSQTQKQIDELKAGMSGGGVADKLQTGGEGSGSVALTTDSNYVKVYKQDEPDYCASFIADNKKFWVGGAPPDEYSVSQYSATIGSGIVDLYAISGGPGYAARMLLQTGTALIEVRDFTSGDGIYFRLTDPNTYGTFKATMRLKADSFEVWSENMSLTLNSDGLTVNGKKALTE